MGDLAIDFGCRPIFTRTDGAPFQPNDVVIVTTSVEAPGTDVDVSEFIGKTGTVEYLEYSCGCGQTFPGDPMIGVAFQDGLREEFWAEELRLGTDRGRE